MGFNDFRQILADKMEKLEIRNFSQLNEYLKAKEKIMGDGYQPKYLKSGLLFSFALATTSLPLLLGIADAYSSHVLFELLGIIILTLLNYSYIFLLKGYKLRRLNPFILIPLNLFILFIGFFGKFPLKVEGNVFAFSMIFLFLPWLLLMIFAFAHHMSNLWDK